MTISLGSHLSKNIMVTQIFWAYFSLTIRFAINKEGRFGLCAE
jgi:hypothetical protein